MISTFIFLDYTRLQIPNIDKFLKETVDSVYYLL